jgi:dUTP pyrophosphatase
MTERVRGFEVVSRFEGQGVELPKRATKGSAGYDLQAAEDVVIPALWKAFQSDPVAGTPFTSTLKKKFPEYNGEFLKSTLVSTGVKAYMPEDEVVILANRSSNPMKRQLALPNGIGVIDADYYGNESNEGEIFVQLINYGHEDIEVKKGERIAQAIFQKYLVVDDEVDEFETRIGGFGSSGM